MNRQSLAERVVNLIGLLVDGEKKHLGVNPIIPMDLVDQAHAERMMVAKRVDSASASLEELRKEATFDDSKHGSG
jgi:hypothetical protein